MSPSLLFVDDDVALAEVSARGLERRGYTVTVARNLAEAAEAGRQRAFARAVVDLRLGDESGLDAITELHERNPACRVVVLTGYASSATAVEAVKRGASEYLTKPAALDEIVQALEDDSTVGEDIPIPDEPMSVRRLTWEHINRVLHETGGNVSEAARRLGMHRRTLQRMLYKRPPPR